MDTALSVVVLLLVAAFVAYRLRKPPRSGKGNVTALSDYRKRKKTQERALWQTTPRAKPHAQKCSYCRKPAKRLTFYADDDGTVIGVCPACRPLAKKRDLMPL